MGTDNFFRKNVSLEICLKILRAEAKTSRNKQKEHPTDWTPRNVTQLGWETCPAKKTPTCLRRNCKRSEGRALYEDFPSDADPESRGSSRGILLSTLGPFLGQNAFTYVWLAHLLRFMVWQKRLKMAQSLFLWKPRPMEFGKEGWGKRDRNENGVIVEAGRWDTTGTGPGCSDWNRDGGKTVKRAAGCKWGHWLMMVRP